MTLTEKTTHVTEGLAKLTEYFSDADNLKSVLTSYLNQIQELESVFFQLLEDRLLDNAEGVQLDGFGQIVGEDREGRGDDDYRLAIRARILLNLCEGTPEDLIELFSVLTGQDVRVYEYWPAALALEIQGPIEGATVESFALISRNTGNPLLSRNTGLYLEGYVLTAEDQATILKGFLEEAKPAGVLANLVYYTNEPVKQFDVSGQGFDQGKFAGAI